MFYSLNTVCDITEQTHKVEGNMLMCGFSTKQDSLLLTTVVVHPCYYQQYKHNVVRYSEHQNDDHLLFSALLFPSVC